MEHETMHALNDQGILLFFFGSKVKLAVPIKIDKLFVGDRYSHFKLCWYQTSSTLKVIF